MGILRIWKNMDNGNCRNTTQHINQKAQAVMKGIKMTNKDAVRLQLKLKLNTQERIKQLLAISNPDLRGYLTYGLVAIADDIRAAEVYLQDGEDYDLDETEWRDAVRAYSI